MRVVYLNPCGQLGGAETSLLEIFASLRSAVPAWELSLVLGEDGPLRAAAGALGVQVIVEPFPAELARLGDARKPALAALAGLFRAAGAVRRYQRRLREILEALQPDVVHTNGFKMHVLGACARNASAPLVWHIHDYVSTRPLMSRLLRIFHRRCSLAIVNSKSVAEDLRSLLPNLRTVPVYNAVDVERFSPAGSKLDLEALSGLPPGDEQVLRVGLIGTFARWKGHQVFLRALAQLPAELHVRGYIIGGPIYQTSDSQWTLEELRQEADRLKLGNRIGFTGFLQDIPGAMRALDIVVHASTQPEPFGMVIIEAMACGKAVIASQAGGAQELFVDGQTALGHPSGDATALAQQIRRLASDSQLRQELGAAGRANVEKHYHGKRLAGELLSIYGQLADAAAGRWRESEMRSYSSTGAQ